MVCIPCILVPVALWLYVRFIQPLVMRFIPEKYRSWLDGILYPMCPAKLPPPAESSQTDACSCKAEGDCASHQQQNSTSIGTGVEESDADKKND